MSKKYHSGSDMYKKHRDLIASIMEQADNFEDEIDDTINERRDTKDQPGYYLQSSESKRIFSGPFKTAKTAIIELEAMDTSKDFTLIHFNGKKWAKVDETGDIIEDNIYIKEEEEDLEESADHPKDCRCKMCKPSIYEGHDESDYPEEWLDYISDTEAARLMKYHDKLERGEKLGDAREDFDMISDKLSAGYDEQERKHRARAERSGVMGESADHPEDCRCKMCKPSIYEGDEEDLGESADHPEDCRCKMCKPSIYEESDDENVEESSDDPCWDDYEQYGMKKKNGKKVPNCVPKESVDESEDETLEKAKKEIEEESELALEVAEDHGQLFDNVKHMSWFVQEVADKIKEGSALEEKDMNTGIIDSKYELKKHIANNFDFYQNNIMRLYPEDLKHTKEVFLRFLKGQQIDKEKLEKLGKVLDKKIREVGDSYDEMSNFIEMVKKFG